MQMDSFAFLIRKVTRQSSASLTLNVEFTFTFHRPNAFRVVSLKSNASPIPTFQKQRAGLMFVFLTLNTGHKPVFLKLNAGHRFAFLKPYVGLKSASLMKNAAFKPAFLKNI